ncbi:hypothetical protein N7462_005257 [Penicillium macrosclerotiorum]|uniref:uncharacterized protein n=1 Tax=Penicillium macrosclerotiorum TaxID=303699 RepID=UPI002548ECA0|nr:uncharacterized protein N7462_005257 [Penicillium macrosclerotiorum]KAJ5690865.1 hypothetical protein N7462_005257 [Penicillium macrosclerotiorum]
MALPYTVAPHLSYFKAPLADFLAARPEFDSLGVGGYLVSTHAVSDAGAPRILLLQRALTDTMGGCWEGPGGATEPGEDETLLDGVAREVLEETGLHVSHIAELVAVDSWNHVRGTGEKLRIAKYSFLVEVHEASRQGPDAKTHLVSRDEIPVKLDAAEHQAFNWALEEEIQLSLLSSEGKYSLPRSVAAFAHQGPNILRAFDLFRQRQGRTATL